MYHKDNWDEFFGWCKVRGDKDLWNRDKFLKYRVGVNYRYVYDYDWYSDGVEWHIRDAVKIYNGKNWAYMSLKTFKKLFVEVGPNLILKCNNERLKPYDLYYLEEELG